nr:MAG TPA: hypothetical protein [Herelleviridae sp.]
MAQVIKNIEDLLKPSVVQVDIADQFIVTSALSDGYTGTVHGNYVYKVTKTGTDYKVNELIYDAKKNEYTPSDEPIIITDDNEIFFITNTLKDPYNFATVNAVELVATDVKEKQVLQAFIAFAEDRFKFANYNSFLADNPFVLGEATE